MQLLERHDQWARAHLQALLHHKKISVPPDFQMLRPGEEEKPVRKVENDSAVIAAWFQNNLAN